MKSYHDIAGDGGSRIVEQIGAQRSSLAANLAGVRHLLAVGSGKGGVGKSTLCFHLAVALAGEGRRVAVLDADLNGPTQARLAGLPGVPLVPVDGALEVPATAHGVGVISLGSLLPGGRPLAFDSVSEGDSHTWRATREMALLAQLLSCVRWGQLDVLLVDLPPGPERTAQYAEGLGARTAFVLLTLPSAISRGVVGRAQAALAELPNRLLGIIENMSGYHCEGCDRVGPLFPDAAHDDRLPVLGRIPFDPQLARLADAGRTLFEMPDGPTARALRATAGRIAALLEERP